MRVLAGVLMLELAVYVVGAGVSWAGGTPFRKALSDGACFFLLVNAWVAIVFGGSALLRGRWL